VWMLACVFMCACAREFRQIRTDSRAHTQAHVCIFCERGRGKVTLQPCAVGVLGLDRLYHPRRLWAALQNGDRGLRLIVWIGFRVFLAQAEKSASALNEQRGMDGRMDSNMDGRREGGRWEGGLLTLNLPHPHDAEFVPREPQGQHALPSFPPSGPRARGLATCVGRRGPYYVMHVPWPPLPTLALCRLTGVSEFYLLLPCDPSSLPTMRPLLSVTLTMSPSPLLRQVPFVWTPNVGGS
jgi:hypothetical protein